MRRQRWFNSSAVLVTFILTSGCGQQSERKIKLSSESSSQDSRVQTVSSTLQVDPEEQHTIAILPFSNETNDPNLDWLKRGLAAMLTAELSQSVYRNVVSMNRLFEVAKGSGRPLRDLDNPDTALQVAKEAKVRTLVRGSFSKDNKSLRIYGILQDVASGEMLMKEYVQGPNLERIFSMMTDLSGRLASNLRGALQRPSKQKRSLAAMTHSLEAFKCYSEALDNLEKYFFSEADKCLTDAIALDSTFAAAYLLQSRTKSYLGDFKAIPKSIRKARQYADRLSESDKIWLRLMEAQIDGDYNHLLSAIQELLDYEPHDLDTRLQLAQ